jgi:hypothetical protein
MKLERHKAKKPGYPTLAGAVAAAVLAAAAIGACGPADQLMGESAAPQLPDASVAPPAPDAGDLMMGVAGDPDPPPPGGVP